MWAIYKLPLFGACIPKLGDTIPHMGNELADAIRAEMRSALLSVYGTLEEAAAALGVPYNTLRRHLTPAGKDRTARVTLDFVIQVCNHLARVANIDLAEIYRRAELSAGRPNVRGLDDDEEVMSDHQADYDRAARKRSKDRGLDIDFHDPED